MGTSVVQQLATDWLTKQLGFSPSQWWPGRGATPFSLPHHLSPEHLAPWGEGVPNLRWWTHLTQSPKWKSSWWVGVIKSISTGRKSLCSCPKKRRGKCQGWGHSFPRPPSHPTRAHTRRYMCTMCHINRLQRAWLTPGVLTVITSQSLEKHSVSPPCCSKQPKQIEISGTYRGKRSPRAECHKTRHRSVWCRGCQRCSQEPSTSQGGRSAGKEKGY